MDAGITRASIPERKDPHGWNTWDHLRTIHERLLAEHTFVDYSQRQTLDFETDAVEGATLLRGNAFCYRNVILEAECWFNLRYFVNLLRARADSCRYSPWVQRGGRVVRYHNVHVYKDYYHHRAFDLATDQ